jgi:RIO kinase 2
MRTMDRSDFRVLEAVEQGMQDRALVPLALVHTLAGLRHGGSHKILSSLLRDKLLSHERKGGTDGYRVTNAGYDILALHNLKGRGHVAALGQRIGTGKESDVYLAATPEGRQIVLKFHRLGRTSFRNVRKKRDYFNNCGSRSSKSAGSPAHSWLFLSRLSALKEYAFCKALHDAQYTTPIPLAHNRHVIAMGLVRGVPLYQVYPKQVSACQASSIYAQSVDLARRLAQKHGLIHCDLNEFNLLVDLSGIQALAASDADDPYVRHAGRSVAPERSVGALSKPAWEQSLLEEHPTDSNPDPLPEPVERLADGEPKPVVTLIDFPQMISTQHPNAKEMYERDLACLRRFFEMKFKCTSAADDDDGDDDASHSDRHDPMGWDAIMKSNVTEKRLDEDLKASGYTDIVANRDLELYYFNNYAGPCPPPLDTAALEEEEEEESDLHDEEESDSNNGDDDKPAEDENDADACAINLTGSDEGKGGAFISRGGEVEVEDLSDVRLENLSMMGSEAMQSMTREMLQTSARDRVRRQIEEQRRRRRKQGALRKGNSNKTYVKGKRVMADAAFL